MGEHIEQLMAAADVVSLGALQKVKEHYRGETPVKEHLRGGDGPQHRAYVAAERVRLAGVLKESFPQLTDEDVQAVVSNLGNSTEE